MQRYETVDAYLAESELWPEEVASLRAVLLATGLTEEVKWGKPCYSHGGKNIVIVQEFKEFLALMFFKGALLDDPEGVLEDQGPNSRSARRMRFESVDDVERRSSVIAAYVADAVDVEEAGLEVTPPPEPVLVDELAERLDADPALRAAFEALTPGRRRQYNLYFGEAKRPETRVQRIERNVERILGGKGLRDR